MKKLWSWILDHPGSSALALGVFMFLGFIGWNLLRPIENAALTAIHAAGYPVTLNELHNYYATPPSNQNAAFIYSRVFSLVDLNNQNSLEGQLPEKQLVPPRGQPLTSEVRTNFARILAENRELFSLLHEATNYSACRFPIDLRVGFNILLPHLSKTKRLTTLLTTEGLLYASDRRPEECAKAFRAAQAVAGSVSQEPILISHLVHIACSTITIKRLELALNLVELSAADLSLLQKHYASCERSPGMARAFAGERAFGLAFFLDPRIQGGMFGNTGGGNIPQGLAGRALFTGLKASGLLAKDRAYYLSYMSNTVALAELPVTDRFKVPPGSMPQVATNRFLLFSRLLLPALARAIERDNEYIARLRVVQTGLAIERYRAAHAGALPQSLDQLAPTYIGTLPIDLDGSPLKFQKLDKGYRIYSTGIDGRDDGGKETDPARDLTFTVER